MTKQTSKLKILIATASVFAFLAGPLAGSAFAEGSTSSQGSGKGGPQGGGQKGGHGGTSAVTGGGSGSKAGGTKISGKDLARLNSARVFLSTGITKTDAIYEDESPLSKIYNYQQLLLANDKNLDTTAEVSAAVFNLARVSAIPVTADTLTKLDALLGTTFYSTYNWSTGGAAVEAALEATTLSVLGQTVDIAQPTSFIDAVNLLQKALKAEEE
jgi:hypothetical protein